MVTLNPVAAKATSIEFLNASHISTSRNNLKYHLVVNPFNKIPEDLY